MIQESDLLRYVEGECTPAEAAAIQAWLLADPQRCAQLEELRVVWRHTGATARRWDVRRARDRLRRARGLDPTPRIASVVRSPWSRWRAWSVAAGLIIAAVVSAVYVTSRTSPRTYETERGQLMTLSLADGSRVVLSPASRLLVPARFGASERVVELEGEAYFIVEHDATRPLLVRTAYGVVEDLGTEFDVRAYPQDSAVQVVVASGRVLLHGPPRANTASRALRPHDRGVVEADGSLRVVNDVELDRYMAWTEGRLVFDQTPLAEIVTDLERWYGLDIEVEGPALDDERVTISFAQQTADQALSELATVLHARHARSDGRVRLIRDHPPQ
jgi:transmembrane sensor